MRIDAEMEKVQDELLNGERSYERSESFKRFVQYEQLQENIDYDAKEPISYQAKREASPTIFGRRESKLNKRISLMKTTSVDFNQSQILDKRHSKHIKELKELNSSQLQDQIKNMQENRNKTQ